MLGRKGTELKARRRERARKTQSEASEHGLQAPWQVGVGRAARFRVKDTGW